MIGIIDYKINSKIVEYYKVGTLYLYAYVRKNKYLNIISCIMFK